MIQDLYNVINEETKEELKNYNEFADADFINDEEKMSDFKVLSKEEFLESYDYITEEEYNNTYNKYYWRNKQWELNVPK